VREKTMRHPALKWIAALALTTAACGGAAPTPAATAVQPPAPQTSPAQPQAAQPGPQGSPQTNQNPAALTTPVDFEQLIALLPEAPSGWTRGKPRGGQVGMGAAISTAEATYENGDSLIHLEMIDSSFNPVYLAPLQFSLAAGYSERSPNGYTKATPIGASPGFEKWDNETKSAEVTMVVANRIIVSAKGRNVDNVDGTRKLVMAVDQSKVRALR
jgi:hypothetical protein